MTVQLPARDPRLVEYGGSMFISQGVADDSTAMRALALRNLCRARPDLHQDVIERHAVWWPDTTSVFGRPMLRYYAQLPPKEDE